MGWQSITYKMSDLQKTTNQFLTLISTTVHVTRLITTQAYFLSTVYTMLFVNFTDYHFATTITFIEMTVGLYICAGA